MSERRKPRDLEHEAELHPLETLADAVAAAGRIEDVLELVAEEARHALGAASVSISRWEPDRDLLRTLINVGDLGPTEERFPADEVYLLAQHPFEAALLKEGEPWTAAIGGPAPAQSIELLEHLCKESALGVPIMVDGAMWGELMATTARGTRRFGPRDVSFLEAISAQVALAIGRAEMQSQIVRLAFEDALTGCANRRALDERLATSYERAAESGSRLSLLLCDADGLKEINDRHGHQVGDNVLVRVALALEAEAASYEGSLVCRIGGDEFCVVLEGHDPDAAPALARDAGRTLARAGEPAVSLSCGVASLTRGVANAVDLLRVADAALYEAKRAGRGQVRVSTEQPLAQPAGGGDRRALRGRRPRHLDELLAAVVKRLDEGLPGADALDRLEAVASTFSGELGAAGWIVSFVPRGGAALEAARRGGDLAGSTAGIALAWLQLGDDPQPATAMSLTRILAAGGGAIVRMEDPLTHSALRSALRGLGCEAVMVAAAPDAARAYLVEIFFGHEGAAFPSALPALRLLVREAVAAALPVPTT